MTTVSIVINICVDCTVVTKISCKTSVTSLNMSMYLCYIHWKQITRDSLSQMERDPWSLEKDSLQEVKIRGIGPLTRLLFLKHWEWEQVDTNYSITLNVTKYYLRCKTDTINDMWSSLLLENIEKWLQGERRQTRTQTGRKGTVVSRDLQNAIRHHKSEIKQESEKWKSFFMFYFWENQRFGRSFTSLQRWKTSLQPPKWCNWGPEISMEPCFDLE